MRIQCSPLVWGEFISILADERPALAQSLDERVNVYGTQYTLMVYDDLSLIRDALRTAEGRLRAW